jgi:hypothetical protein
MDVYNYEGITYHVTGMSVINDLKGTRQEGILIHLRPLKPELPSSEGEPRRDCSQYSMCLSDEDWQPSHCNDCHQYSPKTMDIFLDKHDCVHITKTTQEGRRFWKKFRLPKMVRQ